MADSAVTTVCLNMIVKNEAHIVHEALEVVAPYITYWVIVDTGSTDGTPDVIRAKMADLGIPGELHERPWRDFGYNRTEALKLAQGHCDYIWVMDADDTVVGTPSFNGLTAEGYLMLIDLGGIGVTFWRLQLFRDGVPWRYVGVLHEGAVCDDPHTEERLEGDYRILARQRGGRSLQVANKFEHDRDILLAEVERNPDDTRSTFYLARTYEWLGDHAEARRWYSKRAQMGGWDEEIFCSMFRMAAMMDDLGEPWADVLDAYLRAWAFRPSRPEALNAIAFHYRKAERFELAYLFASRAAQMPFPSTDIVVVVNANQWLALDEMAVCGWNLGRQHEALRIWREVLRRDDVPDDDRARIIANRDFAAARTLEGCVASSAKGILPPPARSDAETTVLLTGGSDRASTERTLNSFLRCCTDVTRVGRFLTIDAGMTAAGRAALLARYPFLDFLQMDYADLNALRNRIGGRFWLDLRHGWSFFTEEALITRLTDVLETERGICKIGINLADACELTQDSPARSGVRVTPKGNRYVLTENDPTGPTMFDISRLHQNLENPSRSLNSSAATLDEVLAIHD